MTPRRPENPEPLLIDRAAAAETPSPEATQEWARDKRAFVSSVMSELKAERQAVAEGVREMGARPILFEEFGGRDADPENAFLGEVETSDIYIGVLGRRYGKPLPSRFSATHTEYLHAEQRGLRIAVWTLGASDREGHQQSFLDEVRMFHTAPEFSTPADLGRQVKERLQTIAAEDLAPWCKLGNIVFRASEINDTGEKIRVVARVRGDDVAHALEQTRGDRMRRGDDARFTSHGRSWPITVASVESTATTARSKKVRLQLEVRDDSRDRDLEMTIQGHSPDALTEAALRTALFGERNPLVDRHMGLFEEMPDPFSPLRQAMAPDEIIRPLAELLLVEALVGSGRAARISAFKLGASVAGQRKLTLSWETPRRSGERAGTRTVTGQVRL